MAHLIHTYQTDGDPLPPFSGEPREIAISGTAETLADELWQALDRENRVALYVRLSDLANGRFTSAMRNKQLGD